MTHLDYIALREALHVVLDWLNDRAAARRTDGLSLSNVGRMIDAAVQRVKREKAE